MASGEFAEKRSRRRVYPVRTHGMKVFVWSLRMQKLGDAQDTRSNWLAPLNEPRLVQAGGPVAASSVVHTVVRLAGPGTEPTIMQNAGRVQDRLPSLKAT